MKFAALLVVVALAMAAGGVVFDAPILGLSPGAFAAALVLGVFAVLNVFWYLAERRGSASSVAAQALAWMMIFALAIGGYSYRQEFSGVASRVMDELVPGRAPDAAPGEAIAVRRRDGHYAFEARANGAKVTMMFDTGASSVVLTAQDAQRMDADLATLRYVVPVSTANGQALAAPFTIETLTIGNITMRRVRALVARQGALNESLLGQSFLERLSRYSVEQNRLVLKGS